MMSKQVNRRGFMKQTAAAAGIGAMMEFGFEEKALLANASDTKEKQPDESTSTGTSSAAKPAEFPMGKIGDLQISRLICGGNLISGHAHSRDLIYVSKLLKEYFTDEKVMETLQLCEQQGINTAILRIDDHTLRIINKYWHERGGAIQWIAQAKKVAEEDMIDIRMAIDNGAQAVYVHGGVGDSCAKNQRIDILGKAVDLIRDSGVPAGIAGHSIEVPIACEQAGIKPDFYMKTLNSKKYWSAGPQPRMDSVWAETPEKTIEFMQTVDKPWIAYKVLGAGAIHPTEGFQYAYENGADFLCVGMFDFQVAEDVHIARYILAKWQSRKRPWRG